MSGLSSYLFNNFLTEKAIINNLIKMTTAIYQAILHKSGTFRQQKNQGFAVCTIVEMGLFKIIKIELTARNTAIRAPMRYINRWWTVLQALRIYFLKTDLSVITK
jgi:hypothetical protein